MGRNMSLSPDNQAHFTSSIRIKLAILVAAMAAAHELNSIMHCSQSEHLVQLWDGLLRFLSQTRRFASRRQ